MTALDDVRNLQRNMGWSYYRLARELGRSRAQLYAWEAAGRAPTMAGLAALGVWQKYRGREPLRPVSNGQWVRTNRGNPDWKLWADQP